MKPNPSRVWVIEYYSFVQKAWILAHTVPFRFTNEREANEYVKHLQKTDKELTYKAASYVAEEPQ